ncbi:hypothetical protein [Myceligenerans crystallogenes]|uniref:LysM domain-containing protein n=1 Tax=Myceligenerans crystallogenes TaxID=316335 RepID=A0ABN2NJB4_9MICO
MTRTRHLIAAVLTAAIATIAAVAPPAGGPPAAAATASPAAASPGAATVAPGEDVRYYVIQVKQNGEPEFLFEIAQRYLGDGNRYTEIFELNKDRPQPDGNALTVPEVVLPGWILLMPDDAEGEGIVTGPLPEVTPPPAASPEPAATGDADTPQAPLWLVLTLSAAGLLVVVLAGGVVLLVRRRRAPSDPPFDDSLLRTDTSSAWVVDRALRVLLAGCERDGLDVPPLTAVFVEGPNLRLRLQHPANPAPAPWVVSDDGGSWSAPIGTLQTEPASTASTERYSRLVTLGVGETGRVLIDFARARGIISIEGPAAARHEVLRRWLGELTGNPWSASPRVVMVGNGLPRPEAAEHVAGIEQVVPELVLGHGGVLVLSRAPAPAQQELLASRFSDPRFGWVVIVLGQVPVARWRFTARDDGWLRSSFLPDVRFDEQTAVRRAGTR